MHEDRLFKNRQTYKCKKATYIWLRQRYVEMSAMCSEMEFSMYGEEGY